MATSGFANTFYRHGLQITISIATYNISKGMSVVGASVHRTDLQIISLRICNTPVGLQPISNAQQCQYPASHCWTLVAPCSPRIQLISTYFLHCERPPEAWPHLDNTVWHAWSPPELDFPLHEDARMARQVQCNLVICACLPQPLTKKSDIWRCVSMEGEGDEGNEPVPA
jgi:hypothetical protein